MYAARHTWPPAVNTSILSKAKYCCPVHQHDQNYYCLEDKCLVCIYCAYHGDHASHQCRPVNEAKHMVREDLQGVRRQAKSQAMEMERRLKLLVDEQDTVRTQAQNASRLVEDYFRSLETALRRQRDMLLQDLKFHASDVTSSLDLKLRYRMSCLVTLATRLLNYMYMKCWKVDLL